MADPRFDTPHSGNPQLGDDPDPFLAALDAEAEVMGQERQVEAEANTKAIDDQARALSSTGMTGIPNSLTTAIGSGGMKALFETKDFLFGEPNYADKSDFRKSIEGVSDDVRRANGINAVAGSVSQFITGMAGAGKIIGPLKKGGTLLKAGWESLKAAGVGATVFDPHEERLANIAQQFPSLQGPITDYLAADPSDSNAEGRFKSAIESIGMDTVLGGAFLLGLKGLRLIKSGTPKNIKQGEKLIEQANEQVASRQGVADAAQGVWDQAAGGPQKAIDAAPGAKPVEPPRVAAEGEAPQVSPAGALKVAPPADASLGPVQPTSSANAVAPPKVAAEGAATQTTVQGDLTQPTDIKPITAPKDIPEEDAARILDASDTKTAAQLLDQPGIAPSGLIPWNKVGGPDEIRLYVQRVAEVVRKRIIKAKGGDVLSDARVQRMVQARAELFNEDPALVMGWLKQQGKNANSMVADMEATYAVANAIMQDSYKMAQKIKYGALEQWGGNAEAAMEEFLKITSMGVEMLGSARAMTANFGRGLRRQRSEFRLTQADIDKFKTLDPSALVEAVYHSQGDAKLIKTALSPSYWQRLMKGTEHLLINGPLWWYPTHIVNGISNLYLLHARPLEKIIGATITGHSEIRKQALKEYRFMYSSIRDGIEAAGNAFVRGDSAIAPHTSAFQDLAASGQHLVQGFRPFRNISDLVHNALFAAQVATGAPTRSLGAVDEMVKVIRYRGVVQARAAQEAADQGLSGAQAQAYIKKTLEDSFDDAGQAIDKNALREAQETTFSQPLQSGTLGHTLQTAVAQHPFLRAVFTYVRTPINAMRYTWKMTPGLNMLQTKFRGDLLGSAGPEAQAHAVGQMALGGLYMAAAGGLAMNGNLTGRGPTDFKLREELMARGWRPYQFTWQSEDGKRHYIPLGRLDPIGMLFGIMGDFHDISQHPDKYESGEEVLGAAAVALMHNITNRTYLMSLQQAIRAASDPDNSLAKWVGNTAEAIIPGSALIRGLNPDPYMRDARTMMDNFLDNMPGYGNKLPPKRNSLGEPIIVQRGLWSESKTDLVDDELMRIIFDTDGGITSPSPNRNGVDQRDIVLEDGSNAYDRIQELSSQPIKGQPTLREALAKLFKDKRYVILPDGASNVPGTKSYAVAVWTAKYREAAFNRLLRDSKIFRDKMNEQKRKSQAAARLAKNPANQPPPASDSALGMLLDMFNLQPNQ